MSNLRAVLTRPKVSENYSRNAFDRSFSPKLTYQLGALQPFFAEQFIAGSHVKLNRSIFQRTAAVNTAAFPKVDTHCEFFYVPLRLLWMYWGNWKLNIQDYNSSIQGNYASGVFTAYDANCPSFDLNKVRDAINAKLCSTPFTPDSPLFANETEATEANRLLDGLGYGYCKGETKVDDDDYESFAVNPFKLLAYQKIYYDHFRNTAYETNDPTYYNWDRWSSPLSVLPDEQLTKIFTYRYVNYRKDYFQALYPSLNYTVSSPNGLSWNIPNSVLYQVFSPSAWPTKDENTIVPSGQSGQVDIKSSYGVSSGGAVSIRQSVQQIRAAFALDKLLRASAYAPKHVCDQFEARYGVKGVENNMESVRIGAYMNDIVFQEVVNTAQNLGAIGAKGIGHDSFGNDIEWTCKEDCVILGLMYSLPRSSYDSTRVQNWNAKFRREDFFIPEYMNLGMQPLYKYEFLYDAVKPSNNTNIPGYQDRYIEYKCGIDVNHGIFNKGGALSDFVVHTQGGRSSNYATMNGVSSSFFKVDPHDMDSIFVQATDRSDEETDKFITYMDVKCVVNQNMSVHGQPISVS